MIGNWAQGNLYIGLEIKDLCKIQETKFCLVLFHKLWNKKGEKKSKSHKLAFKKANIETSILNGTVSPTRGIWKGLNPSCLPWFD